MPFSLYILTLIIDDDNVFFLLLFIFLGKKYDPSTFS
jgi:hypothetical protein